MPTFSRNKLFSWHLLCNVKAVYMCVSTSVTLLNAAKQRGWTFQQLCLQKELLMWVYYRSLRWHLICMLINSAFIHEELLLHDQNKPVCFLYHIHNLSFSTSSNIAQSFCFHVQLWISHPARGHLTPALKIFGKCPKNTDPGSITAIFANSAHTKTNILMNVCFKGRQVLWIYRLSQVT